MVFVNQRLTRRSLLTMTDSKRWISAKDVQQPADSPTSDSCEYQVIDRMAFLQLPVAQRNALLAQQVAFVVEHFLLGTEEMEWTDEYIDDDLWDLE